MSRGRPGSARLAAGALAAAALTILPARAGLPDWARSVADAAPPVPEGMPDWPEQILLWERHVTLDPDGVTWRIHERSAIQVLSNRVDDTAVNLFQFDDTTKVKKSKGWHVPLGERAQRNLGGAVDIALGDEFLSDAKARAVALEGVRKGSLVFYEFDAEAKPYTLTFNETLQADIPISVGRWIIDLPAGWTLRYAWLPDGGPEPSQQGSTWTFERRNVPAVRAERMGIDPRDATPRLVIAMVPPPGATAPALTDWNAVGKWWSALAKGRDAVDPAIARVAKETAATAGSGFLGRVRALALYTRDRVRYLAREVGIGGYQPHAASAVLSDLYGDCKDKGTLFRALLAAEGIVSYPIFVNATREHTVAASVPTPGAFDHFVVGVLWPKDDPIPEEVSGAIVDVPAVGRLLVVDTTNEDAWPGTLSASLAGKTALVVTPDAGTLVALPAGDPKANRVETSATTTVNPDSSLAVALEMTYSGWTAEIARAAYARSSEDRRRDVEDEVREAWPGAQILDYKVTPETAAGAYVETLRLEIPANAGAIQDGTVPLFPGAGRAFERVSVTHRNGAVLYRCPETLRFDETLVGATPDAPLPQTVAAEGDGWSVKAAAERQGEAIRATWSFERSRTRFDPAAFPEVKKMWSSASRAASLTARVKP